MNIDHTLIKNNKGNQMNQRRNYDLLLLLAGENEKIFPRSKKVIELYEKGTIGDILVSGSAGGFSQSNPSSDVGSHIEIANFLNINGIPAKNIYTDWRPVDTLGNFAFPYADPISGNPNPNDLETVFLTEWGHMDRTKECAEKVISLAQVDYVKSPGEYGNQSFVNNAITAVYHSGLMKQTRDINADPKKALDFLKEEHPFYKAGWFEKPVLERQMETIRKIISWNIL